MTNIDELKNILGGTARCPRCFQHHNIKYIKKDFPLEPTRIHAYVECGGGPLHLAGVWSLEALDELEKKVMGELRRKGLI